MVSFLIYQIELTLPCTAQHCTAVPCTALNRTPLHYTATHFPALHHTSLHCTALHRTSLHCTARPCTALHRTSLHSTSLHCTAPHFPAPYVPTLYCTALPCTARFYTTLHCTSLRRTSVHCSALPVLYCTVPHIRALHRTPLHIPAPHTLRLWFVIVKGYSCQRLFIFSLSRFSRISCYFPEILLMWLETRRLVNIDVTCSVAMVVFLVGQFTTSCTRCVTKSWQKRRKLVGTNSKVAQQNNGRIF